MLTGMVDGLDGVLNWFYQSAKMHVSDFSMLETAEDDHTLVASDGSLLSLIKVLGVRSIINENTFYGDIIGPLNSSIQTRFAKAAHAMQVWFEVDPDRTKEDLENTLRPSRDTAKRLQLDMDDLFRERIQNMSRWTRSETCYIALWTRPSALSKSDREVTDAERKDVLKDAVARPKTKRGQRADMAIPLMMSQHTAFVASMQSEMAHTGISTRLLAVNSAARAIRFSVDPEFTAYDWEPSLPDRALYPHERKQKSMTREWDIVWPKLSWQVAPRDAKQIAENAIQIGERAYAPMYINLFPSSLKSFNYLFNRANERKIPWRMSFFIEGDGLKKFNFRAMLAGFLAFAGAQNKLVKESLNQLKDLATNGNTPIVSMQACFSTWAPAGDTHLLAKRSADLAQAVTSWEGCQIAEQTGDPLAGVMSSALALAPNSVGTAVAAPFDHALYMLPFGRPASPWEKGAVLFRTPDGKLMPYQPYSKEQATWINIIFAPPGSGKSVLMNVCHLALCLDPGLRRLPRISIIDIGPSSSGLISLLQEALPPEKRHLVAYHRLSNTRDKAINPFDTMLGCRYPTSTEKAFLQNLMGLMVSEPGANGDLRDPPSGMLQMCNLVLEEMYRMRSEEGDPNRYTNGFEHLVDEAIERLDLKKNFDSRTSWYEVADHLALAGEFHLAGLAQRHASPTLSDASGAAKSERIRGTYDIKISGSNETLVDAFVRILGGAINTFPLFSGPTRFDIGDARVVSLDLNDVARGGGMMGDYVTAVMYMLARHVSTRTFYMGEETIKEIPFPVGVKVPPTVPAEMYRKYHAKNFEENFEDPKRVCYDEFHRTSKAEQVRRQVILDMREGRKWRVDVMLASQSLQDFDERMMEFATGIFVMAPGNNQTISAMKQSFGFSSQAEEYALRNQVHTPRKGGNAFLAKFVTNSGTYSLLLSSTLGPIELWAFNTTADDVVVRNRLYKAIGPAKARQLLSKVFPDGTARSLMEEKKQKLREEGSLNEESQQGVTEAIVSDLIDFYHKSALDTQAAATADDDMK